MVKFLTQFLIVLLFTNLAFARPAKDAGTEVVINIENETHAIWDRTGYSLESLMSEPDFQPSNCIVSEDLFVACVSTLNYMLGLFENSPKRLQFVGIMEVEISQYSESQWPKTSEEYQEEVDAFRSSARTLYQTLFSSDFNIQKSEGADTSNSAFLEDLFTSVATLFEANIPTGEMAFRAGASYIEFQNKAYDPHSSLRPQENLVPKGDNFVGIGSHITLFESEGNELDKALILDPMDGSPAQRAGLKKGDILSIVDGKNIIGMEFDESIPLIKGIEGTTVVLTVKRFCTGQTEEVSVVRGPISVFPTMTSDSYYVNLDSMSPSTPVDDVCGDGEKINEKKQALYIPLTSFEGQTEYGLCTQFRDLLITDMQNNNSEGIILDLRGNRGGSVFEVSCMLNLIISKKGLLLGNIEVNKGEFTNGRSINVESVFSKDWSARLHPNRRNAPFINLRGVGAVAYNKKIVVLVNRGSASASEIFAGTVQDMKRGWVVGDKTFGKGTVQTGLPYFFTGNTKGRDATLLFKFQTTGVYTLNSGRSPQNLGIVPGVLYDRKGEPITLDTDDAAFESTLYKTLIVDSEPWEHNRPDELEKVTECAFSKKSHNRLAKERLASDSPLNNRVFTDFQLSLAQDVLSCDVDRGLSPHMRKQ